MCVILNLFFLSVLFLKIFIYLFIILFLAVLGLRLCARASSSRGKRGPLFIAVRGPLTIAAFPAAEHRLQTRRLSNCGSRAQPLRGTRDLPRPGLEPVCPALAGRLSTTAPPGKPQRFSFHLRVLSGKIMVKRKKNDRDLTIGLRDFFGCPVVKTSSSNAGGMGLTPARGAKIPKYLVVKKPKHKTEAIL